MKKYCSEKFIKISKTFLFALGSVTLLVIAFAGGVYFEYSHKSFVDKVAGVSNTEVPSNIDADFDSFWKVWNMIDQNFPGAKDVSSKDRVYGAIKGLMGSLNDPYSVYFPPQDSKDFQDTINGSFEGIGMEIGFKNKIITVIAPLKNTPAERAGIKAGDVLLKIDGTSTSDMSIDQAVHIIRGKKGTTVKLNIYSEGDKEARDVIVTRDVIEIPTIETKKLDNGVFDIALYNFGANSATQFLSALNEFQKTGDEKLIIDLRGNPGGYLDASVDIASMFLPEGEKIVTESFGGNQKDHVYTSKGYGIIDTNKIKIVILVDKGSASASEILSGALQQHNVAPLIGEKTYGKGSVQEVMPVTSDTSLKMTIAKWLTPDGTWISKKGLNPDIVVTIPKDTDPKKDPVLDRALKYFSDGK